MIFPVVVGRRYRVTYRPGPFVTTGRPHKDRVVLGIHIESLTHEASGDRMLRFRKANGREVGVWESMVLTVEPRDG